MPRPKRPHIVKRTIRGKVRYVVDLGMIEGKRIERFFGTRIAAEEHLADQKDQLLRHGNTAVALTAADRILLQAARDQLAAAGATIDQAVQFFLQHHRGIQSGQKVAEIVQRCIADKQAKGKSEGYANGLRTVSRSFFAGKEDRELASFTRDEIKDWLFGNQFATATQKSYLATLRAFLSWAVAEKYLQRSPLEGMPALLDARAGDDEEIIALGVEQCRALLRTAVFGEYLSFNRQTKVFETIKGWRALIGYLVIGMFCGVRPEEMAKLTSAKLNLRERTLVVTGKTAKSRRRRVIELEKVAVIWLRLWRRWCPGEALRPINFARRWRSLRKAAGVLPWPHDALRHTAATYHFALHQNIAALQALLGHSEDEDTLFRHYRAVETATGEQVTHKLALEFWSITPRTVRTVAHKVL